MNLTFRMLVNIHFQKYDSSDDSTIITKPDKGNGHGIVIVSRLDRGSCFLITPNSNH